jgi:hypothetical protein
MGRDKRIDQLTPSTLPLAGTDLFAIYNANGTRNDSLDSITNYVAQNMTGSTSDSYLTGATLNSTILELGRNQGLSTLSVELSGITSVDSIWIPGTSGTSSLRTDNGTTTDATGTYAIATGWNTASSGLTSTSFGTITKAVGDYSIAMGNSSKSYGQGSFAGGLGTTVGQTGGDDDYGKGSFTYGNSGNNSGWWSMNVGQSNSLNDVNGYKGGIFMYAFGGSNTLESSNTFSTGNNNDIKTFSDYSAIFGGEDNLIKTGSTYNTIVGGSGNTVNDDVTYSTILGGYGITATQSNTTYTQNLNIGTVGGNSPLFNLGIDSSGNVVTGTTGSPNYLVYTALITQVGTSAPTAIVLENTLGGTPVWSRPGDTGIYELTLNGVWTEDKTGIIGSAGMTGNYTTLQTFRQDSNVLYFETFSNGVVSDGVFTNNLVEVRVYQ